MDYETTITVKLTAHQLAEIFITWGSREQGEFLSLVGAAFKSAPWDAESQCYFISHDIGKDGKDFVLTLANFIKAKGIKNDSKVGVLLNSYGCDNL